MSDVPVGGLASGASERCDAESALQAGRNGAAPDVGAARQDGVEDLRLILADQDDLSPRHGAFTWIARKLARNLLGPECGTCAASTSRSRPCLLISCHCVCPEPISRMEEAAMTLPFRSCMLLMALLSFFATNTPPNKCDSPFPTLFRRVAIASTAVNKRHTNSLISINLKSPT